MEKKEAPDGYMLVDDTFKFQIGDWVAVSSNLERVKAMTKGPVGWQDEKDAYVGQVGVVFGTDWVGPGIRVTFSDGHWWSFHPQSLFIKVDTLPPKRRASIEKARSSSEQLATGHEDRDLSECQDKSKAHSLEVQGLQVDSRSEGSKQVKLTADVEARAEGSEQVEITAHVEARAGQDSVPSHSELAERDQEAARLQLQLQESERKIRELQEQLSKQKEVSAQVAAESGATGSNSNQQTSHHTEDKSVPMLDTGSDTPHLPALLGAAPQLAEECHDGDADADAELGSVAPEECQDGDADADAELGSVALEEVSYFVLAV